MPKRKLEDVDPEESDSCDMRPDCSESNDDDSNESANSVSCGSGQPRKKRRKSVNFEQVQVYYFPRAQGFACVPSQGGTTLGMSEKHAHKEEYPLKHYRKLRKLVRRKKADVEESAENSFSIDAINDISQDEIVQTDSEEDDTETDGFFLQPVPIKLRRSLLKLSGVKKLDTAEKEECKELRGSREECGCDCKTVCIPETCLCALNGIQCQVDRFSFPCGCTKKKCHNPAGRIEFNPGKVQRHYEHTMMRLRVEASQVTDSDTQQQQIDAQIDYSTPRMAKHIRFTDEGQTVEGEISFNSTEQGCCLDCSLTTCHASSHHTVANDLQPAALCSVDCSSLSPSPSDELDNDACVFSTASVASSESALPSVSPNNQSKNSNHSSKILEPISELLNPILNTVDSLDMYALSGIQHFSQPNADAADADYNEDTVSEWQSLSHESLLTTNSLIPMKDEESSLSSCGESGESSEAQSVQPLSFTGLKSSPVSFQLQSSHNVMHAMRSEFDDMEQYKPTLTLPVSTEASTQVIT